jgi:NADPH2:quinone reductase
LLPAHRLIRLPDAIDDVTAAAIMVRGITAWYLSRRAYAVQPGDRILLHAAAGGVGLILAQWARHLGATVIGTVGSDEKAEIAKSFGCDHAINYRAANVADTVRQLTGGEGVAAVYDSVGKDTFDASLDSLRRLGHFVMFGAASGDVGAIDPVRLMQKGSIHFTRTSMRHYTQDRSELEAGAAELFDLVAGNKISVKVNKFQGLEAMAAAHRALETRQLTGSTVVEL